MLGMRIYKHIHSSIKSSAAPSSIHHRWHLIGLRVDRIHMLVARTIAMDMRENKKPATSLYALPHFSASRLPSLCRNFCACDPRHPSVVTTKGTKSALLSWHACWCLRIFSRSPPARIVVIAALLRETAFWFTTFISITQSVCAASAPLTTRSPTLPSLSSSSWAFVGSPTLMIGSSPRGRILACTTDRARLAPRYADE